MKAETVFILLQEIEKEIERLERGERIVFITVDLFENFVKYIQFSKNVNVKTACFGVPISNVPVVVGLSGMLNKLEFHIIDGTNKMYGGTKLPVELVENSIKRVNNND